MKNLLLILLLIATSMYSSPIKNTAEKSFATCKGNSPCNACRNCKYCKHCGKDSSSCTFVVI